jgi:succinyl-CoA synthetase alpha subunit
LAEKEIENDRFLAKKNTKGELIKKDREDDLKFLEDQRKPRIGWMAGQDKVYAKRMENKADIVSQAGTAHAEEEARKSSESAARKRSSMFEAETEDNDDTDDQVDQKEKIGND